MSNANIQNKASKLRSGIGYALSAPPVLLMLMSSSMKLSHAAMVVNGFAKAGMSTEIVTIIGVVELLCVVIYLVPATAVLGAILITGFFGGAIMVHVRAGEVAFVAPFLLGMMAWGGLYLRDKRIAELLPLRKRPA
jgi:hypothetical protein